MAKMKGNQKENNHNDVKFYDEKKSLVKKIWDITFWVVICILAFIWIFDFIKVKKNEHPMFCLAKNTYTFSDGTVDECIGLGYKVYEYHRTNLNVSTQFSPFFMGMIEE